ncbi:MAG: hypothetical protein NZT61_00540 [Deltaproteobacteria bacterium]|nr:hypothetical protein [Deltaproteobacteria bacterium]MCX7952029.1 hypothetical protein [Deltaproteobacteria bacterium]
MENFRRLIKILRLIKIFLSNTGGFLSKKFPKRFLAPNFYSQGWIVFLIVSVFLVILLEACFEREVKLFGGGALSIVNPMIFRVIDGPAFNVTLLALSNSICRKISNLGTVEKCSFNINLAERVFRFEIFLEPPLYLLTFGPNDYAVDKKRRLVAVAQTTMLDLPKVVVVGQENFHASFRAFHQFFMKIQSVGGKVCHGTIKNESMLIKVCSGPLIQVDRLEDNQVLRYAEFIERMFNDMRQFRKIDQILLLPKDIAIYQTSNVS